jgi:hypothetical protein
MREQVWRVELLPHDHVEFATCLGRIVDMIMVEGTGHSSPASGYIPATTWPVRIAARD